MNNNKRKRLHRLNLIASKNTVEQPSVVQKQEEVKTEPVVEVVKEEVQPIVEPVQVEEIKELPVALKELTDETSEKAVVEKKKPTKVKKVVEEETPSDV